MTEMTDRERMIRELAAIDRARKAAPWSQPLLVAWDRALSQFIGMDVHEVARIMADAAKALRRDAE